MVEKFLNTAFYIRLSREDSNKGESESIITQKKILSQYIYNKPEFILFDIYIDDGYSGTNFERPSFQRMIEDIEKGFINCVIVIAVCNVATNFSGNTLKRFNAINPAPIINTFVITPTTPAKK